MIVNFDFTSQLDKPYIVLCNPNGEELYSLENICYNTKLEWRFNALSELTFDYPQSVDSGDTINTSVATIYSFIKSKRLVKVQNFGIFTILNTEEEFDGATPIKRVTCVTREGELLYKKLTAFGGTYQFYNAISPSGTLLGEIIDLLPGWSVGSVDGALAVKYRTFDVSDTTIYGFLMNDVSQTFGCVFSFDTVNRTISAQLIDNATTDTSIYLSFDNVLKAGSFKEISDEISTALYVYGGNDLDIRTVNPLGTNVIYNFDYYKSTGWMSSGLVDALTTWEALVASIQPTYASLLTTLKNQNTLILTLGNELSELQTEYTVLETEQKGLIEQGESDLSAINAQLTAKQGEINSKQSEIDSAETSLSSIISQIVLLNDQVSFDNNFTQDQLVELASFTFENTYQNENIIQTDTMTAAQVQDQSQELYDNAQDVLERVSQPRYEFDCDVVNFTALPEYQSFTNQLNLGSVITIELSDNYTISAVLLEISLNFDDPSDFSLTFSNRLRLDNGSFVYSDLMGQVVKTGKSVSFDKLKWGNWSSEYKDDVTTFINSALSAARNQIINSTNQEIVINENGLKGRKSIVDESGTITGYEPQQVWLTNNLMAFTDDGWDSAKLAIGNIIINNDDTPSPFSAFGVVGEYIVGNIIAGNNLQISNQREDGEVVNFTLNSLGATLYNASFTVANNDTKIILNPDEGIRIQRVIDAKDLFYVDSLGNLTFAGTLSGANGEFSGTITANSGSIGGWDISNNGFERGSSLYIRPDGNMKFGGLEISGSTATFQGRIIADEFIGKVTNTNVDDGALSGNKIMGGIIRSNTGGATINLQLGSQITMTAGFIQLLFGSASFQGNGSANTIDLVAPSGVYINGQTAATQTWVTTNFSGVTASVAYTRPGGSTGYLNFTSGRLTSYS